MKSVKLSLIQNKSDYFWNILPLGFLEGRAWDVRHIKLKVQALRLYTGFTALRGNRGFALLFLVHFTRRGWVVSSTRRPQFTPEKDPVPILQEARWAPAPVRTGAENLALSPEFDPRTVQPVASRYTNYSTRPTCISYALLQFHHKIILMYCTFWVNITM